MVSGVLTWRQSYGRVFEDSTVVGQCAVCATSPHLHCHRYYYYHYHYSHPYMSTIGSTSQFIRLSIASPLLLLSFHFPAGEAGPSLVVTHSVVSAYAAGCVATSTAVDVWSEIWETLLRTDTNVGTCLVLPTHLPFFSVPVDAFVQLSLIGRML
jgi:hypothetical protein